MEELKPVVTASGQWITNPALLKLRKEGLEIIEKRLKEETEKKEMMSKPEYEKRYKKITPRINGYTWEEKKKFDSKSHWARFSYIGYVENNQFMEFSSDSEYWEYINE